MTQDCVHSPISRDILSKLHKDRNDSHSSQQSQGQTTYLLIKESPTHNLSQNLLLNIFHPNMSITPTTSRGPYTVEPMSAPVVSFALRLPEEVSHESKETLAGHNGTETCVPSRLMRVQLRLNGPLASFETQTRSVKSTPAGVQVSYTMPVIHKFPSTRLPVTRYETKDPESRLAVVTMSPLPSMSPLGQVVLEVQVTPELKASSAEDRTKFYQGLLKKGHVSRFLLPTIFILTRSSSDKESLSRGEHQGLCRETRTQPPFKPKSLF
jgi:hypothetical protein